MVNDLNYYDTFISVAPDTKALTGTEPPASGSVARTQFEMLTEHPYSFTQEQVLFETSAAVRRGGVLDADERARLHAEFVGRPQACMRAAALPKTYGWGVHFDADGRVGLCALGSSQYDAFLRDDSLTQLVAMRSRRG